MKKKLISLFLVVAMVMSMMVMPVAAEGEETTTVDITDPNYCPHCDQILSEETWLTWSESVTYADGAHYRVAADVTLKAVVTIPADCTVVIDLNGKTITAATDSRCFEVNDELVIVNSSDDQDADGNYTGLITGGKAVSGSGETARGGNIWVSNSATLKLYGGTIANGFSPNAGGNVKLDDNAKFYMYGGTITDGKAETNTNVGNGGNLCIENNALFEMYGGTISDGTVTASGGNIYNYRGTITLHDGEIANGTAGKWGGNIWLNSKNATLNIKGGTISGGTAPTAGGSIYADYATCQITMEGGLITGGTSEETGGNIYFRDGKMHMSGGVISGGTAYTAGGNMFNDGTTNMTGGEITGGKTVLSVNGTGTGGNLQNGGTFNMSGGVISGGTAYYRGGNIYNSGALNMSGDAVVTGGTLYDHENYTSAYGGNYYATGTLRMYDQAVIKNGSAYSGGNVCTATNNGVVYMYGGAIYGGTCVEYGANVRIYNHAACALYMYGGYIEDLNDGGTANVIQLYNGTFGSTVANVTTTDGASAIMSCAHSGTLGSYYSLWHAEGECATCGHTYNGYGVGKEYTSTETTHLTLGGAHTYVDGACSVCGKAATTHTAACSHGCENVTWIEWDGTAVEAGGHYFLADNLALDETINLEGISACIDLNGYTLTAPPANRAFLATGGAQLVLMDSSAENTGLLRSFGLAADLHGANLRTTNSAMYLYDLTVADGVTTGTASSNRGGNIYVYGPNALLVIDNAKVLNGTMLPGSDALRGGNICSYVKGTIVIKGENARIADGYVYREDVKGNYYGGNIHFGQGGALYIYDGVIEGGVAEAGSNISMVNGNEENDQVGNLYMYGGKIGESGTFANGEACKAATLRVAQSATYTTNVYIYGGEVLGDISLSGAVGKTRIYAGVFERNPLTVEDDLTSALADCACVIYDEQTGLYTVGHTKGANTCGICGGNDGGYAAGYSAAHTYAIELAHTYTDSCVCDTCQVVAARIGEVAYTELATALEAAKGTTQTVALAKDLEADGNVEIDCTLDLNGFDLSASGVIDAATGDSFIRDSVGAGSATGTNVYLMNNNGQLAISAENNGIYTFETVTACQKVARDGANASVKFYIEQTADATKLDEAIKNGDNIDIRITVRWGEDQEHSFVYDDDLVAEYLANWDTKMFTCQIANLDLLGECTIHADIKANNVVVAAYDFVPAE